MTRHDTSSATDLTPWLAVACSTCTVEQDRVDIPALLELAGLVAGAGLRPMAPVAAHLWGRAVARGDDPQQALRVIVSSLPTPPVPPQEREDQQHWHRFAETCCRRLRLTPDRASVETLPELSRAVAHASVRPMAPVAAYLLGAGERAGDEPLEQRATALVEAISRVSAARAGNQDPQVAS